ncbi:hypothetical protein [Alicyclobacillus macrosporangiidus]|uniref:Uncharacterized protein n=1 Tax=Alicyclobacillus macrosporangiidus TaxID=392015 RepID=A0A1I7K307_9BACL|nr:hypothetical protein [Alicyclobacillus macrosporangiidus]SFU91807.1 hypothetical protein SAMN05421543_11362 [Alicyclobacillus macrosporangiidus]
MLSFVLLLIVPLWMLFYTVQFGRWLRRREGQNVMVWPVYGIGAVSFGLSVYVLWRMFLS